jgi:transcription elongation factor Elf1
MNISLCDRGIMLLDERTQTVELRCLVCGTRSKRVDKGSDCQTLVATCENCGFQMSFDRQILHSLLLQSVYSQEKSVLTK